MVARRPARLVGEERQQPLGRMRGKTDANGGSMLLMPAEHGG
jgi:hypothetical protein